MLYILNKKSFTFTIIGLASCPIVITCDKKGESFTVIGYPFDMDDVTQHTF